MPKKLPLYVLFALVGVMVVVGIYKLVHQNKKENPCSYLSPTKDVEGLDDWESSEECKGWGKNGSPMWWIRQESGF